MPFTFGPDVHLDRPAYVDPTARIYGWVSAGEGSSFWPYSVIRAEGAASAADMDHGTVLDIAAAADAHRGTLGADHRIGPEAAAVSRADPAVDARGRIDIGGPIEVHVGAESEWHGGTFLMSA